MSTADGAETATNVRRTTGERENRRGDAMHADIDPCDDTIKLEPGTVRRLGERRRGIIAHG
jgi:hypothetical protein